MRALTIGLPWQTYGHGNLGVDALTRSNIAIIRAACARCDVVPKFVLLGETSLVAPDTDDVVQGPRLRLKPFLAGRSEYMAAVRQCDVLFDISEGDSFADIYGGKRFFFQAATKAATIRAGRPLVLSPQTFGPYEARWVRAVAGWIVKRTAGNFSRDPLSTKAIKDLSPKIKVTEVIDVAFRLPFTPAEKKPGRPVQVGINVSGLMLDDRRDNTAKKFALDYGAFLRRLVETLLAEKAEIWLVPHVLTPGDDEPDDRWASDVLLREYPALRVAERFTSASQAKSFISGMDFFSGGRMHACVGAYSSGVPVVPIAYSRKFAGLFGSLGYDHLVDARTMSVDQALKITLDCFRNREALANDILPGLALAKDHLQQYEDEITVLLDRIASGRRKGD